MWQSSFFLPQRNPAHFYPSINWQQIRKKNQKNKNQVNASNLNVRVFEREKLFQLLDVQENMNTC